MSDSSSSTPARNPFATPLSNNSSANLSQRLFPALPPDFGPLLATEKKAQQLRRKRWMWGGILGLVIACAAIAAAVAVTQMAKTSSTRTVGGGENSGGLSGSSGLGGTRNSTNTTVPLPPTPSNVPTNGSSAPNITDTRGGKLGYDSIVVFGASYCDDGHTRLRKYQDSLRKAPYWEGRWTNGPVWNEYLSTTIGAGGQSATLVNYAYGGATIDNAVSPVDVPDIKQQAAGFLSDLQSGSVGASTSQGKALIAVWIGINSVTQIWDTVLKAQQAAASSAAAGAALSNGMASITSILDTLFSTLETVSTSQAFQHPPDILLLPLPPLQLIPVNRLMVNNNAGSLATLASLANAFNSGLTQQLSRMQTTSRSQRVFTYDVEMWWTGLVQNPASEGLTVGNVACLQNGRQCADPAAHVFWDTLHPTTVVHKKVAELIAGVIRA